MGEEGFERFWSAYPRKVAKQASKKAWDRLCPSPELIDAILSAVSAHSASEAWKKDGGAYIPHAATWINGRRWEDQLSHACASMTRAERVRAKHCPNGSTAGPSVTPPSSV